MGVAATARIRAKLLPNRPFNWPIFHPPEQCEQEQPQHAALQTVPAASGVQASKNKPGHGPQARAGFAQSSKDGLPQQELERSGSALIHLIGKAEPPYQHIIWRVRERERELVDELKASQPQSIPTTCREKVSQQGGPPIRSGDGRDVLTLRSAGSQLIRDSISLMHGSTWAASSEDTQRGPDTKA
jgi:hypothetical protein